MFVQICSREGRKFTHVHSSFLLGSPKVALTDSESLPDIFRLWRIPHSLTFASPLVARYFPEGIKRNKIGIRPYEEEEEGDLGTDSENRRRCNNTPTASMSELSDFVVTKTGQISRQQQTKKQRVEEEDLERDIFPPSSSQVFLLPSRLFSLCRRFFLRRPLSPSPPVVTEIVLRLFSATFRSFGVGV